MKFRLFLLFRLPLGFVARLRVEVLDSEKSVVSVPFSFWNKNPFRSVYFAVQAMAAEVSTGLPGFMAVRASESKISMLVTDMNAKFVKKATSRIYFSCSNVPQILAAVHEAKNSGLPQTVAARSVGRLKDGTVVSEFTFTWSFKLKV